MRGPVRIARWPAPGPSFAPPPGLPVEGDVVLTNWNFNSSRTFASYWIAHELGHVWDHRTQHHLSQGLMVALETWRCDESGCQWLPFGKRYDPTTDTTTSPEVPPGTNLNCSLEEMISEVGGCRIPYAATYGLGPWAEGPGWEDWAESFASYIYPSYYPDRGLVGLLPTRNSYVRHQIDSVK